MESADDFRQARTERKTRGSGHADAVGRDLAPDCRRARASGSANAGAVHTGPVGRAHTRIGAGHWRLVTGSARTADGHDPPRRSPGRADSITGLVFDGQTLRIEFSVTRVDEVKPDAPISGRRYPASRIVLSPGAAIELINRMQQIGAALTQAGVAKTAPGRGQKPPSS
jgi:hypothetical protein